MAIIALKCHFGPFFAKNSFTSYQIIFFSQKWHFKAITVKSEENGLCLNFNFTSPRVSQKLLEGLLLPYLETKKFKNQISPMFQGFDNTSQYQYAKWVLNTLTVCFCLFKILIIAQGRCGCNIYQLFPTNPLSSHGLHHFDASSIQFSNTKGLREIRLRSHLD